MTMTTKEKSFAQRQCIPRSGTSYLRDVSKAKACPVCKCKQVEARPNGRCNMRLSQIITYCRLSQNEAFPLLKLMYSTISAEWAADHFGFWFDVNRSNLTKIRYATETTFTFLFQVTVTFDFL